MGWRGTQMQLLNRMDEKTKLSFLDAIPELIHQNYNEPATLKQGEKTWNSTCIGCVNPKCMFYYEDEDICDDIIEFSSEKNRNVCPVSAMLWDDDDVRPIIDHNKCMGCGLCAQRCPVGAIYYDDNQDVVLISENEEATHVPLTNDNYQIQEASLRQIEKIDWKHRFRVEDDVDFDNIYYSLSLYDGRQSVHNLFVRNLLIALGNHCMISRIGDVYTRTDAIYSNSRSKGSIEIEFGKDTLDALRGVLDDIATLQTHNDLDKNENNPIVACMSLPNKRQGYFQVVKDVRKVLDIYVQTLTVGALLLLVWNDVKLDFSEKSFYIDFDNMSIREEMQKLLEREIEITDSYLGILEPEK